MSETFRDAHPEIEWSDITGFRNLAVHEYFAIMWEIVWETAISDLPKLRNQIAAILESEFNQDSTTIKTSQNPRFQRYSSRDGPNSSKIFSNIGVVNFLIPRE